MKLPIGIDDCLTCPVRGEEYPFCKLSVHAGERLNQIKSTAIYPKGAMLFIEGQRPDGVFVLCAGKVKLSTSSREGRRIITRVSEPGDVLGLNAVISNRTYEVSAEMMEPGQANFVPRDCLLHFLNDHVEVALRVIKLLSCNYYTAHEQIRTLGLSVSERVAKFLLSGLMKTAHNNDASQITLSHEEIAESIGTTREIVSRLFSELRKASLLSLRGSIKHKKSPRLIE